LAIEILPFIFTPPFWEAAYYKLSSFSDEENRFLSAA